MATLTPREQGLLRARLGVDLGASSDLEELQRRYGETRKRIEEIEEKALRQMHRPPR